MAYRMSDMRRGQARAEGPSGLPSLVHGIVGPHTVVARVEGHTRPALGESLVFGARPGKLYFFDTATGQRLRG